MRLFCAAIPITLEGTRWFRDRTNKWLNLCEHSKGASLPHTSKGSRSVDMPGVAYEFRASQKPHLDLNLIKGCLRPGCSSRTQCGWKKFASTWYSVSSTALDGELDTVLPWATVQLCQRWSLYDSTEYRSDTLTASFNTLPTLE